jgi:hypothetical protein
MAQDARNCVGGCETEMVMVMAMPRGVSFEPRFESFTVQPLEASSL